MVGFYPATEGLVAYYTYEGAVLDDGATRRMKFNYRPGRQRQVIAGEADAADQS